MSNIFGTGDTKAMQNVIDAASKIMMGVQDEQTQAAQTEDDHPIVAAAKAVEEAKKAKMDPVGKADADIDNDGDVDDSDDYLKNRRKKIKASMKNEAADLDSPAVEKSLKHDCATHVVHKEHGEGRCIPGMHSLEETAEGLGVVTAYDVMFTNDDGPFIVKDIDVNDLEIVVEMSHGHKKKK
jgi:hypothetical protein